MENNVLIVGAGLVGTLAGICFAKRGYNVQIYERNNDIRLDKEKAYNRRSINLALSHRGLKAMKKAGLEIDEFCLNNTVAMKGRLIHNKDGNKTVQLYDVNQKCINSVDRALLNKYLIDEALKYENLKIFFNHKLVSCDYDNVQCEFKSSETKLTVKADLIVGADGSYSQVRKELTKKKLNYSQHYMDHGYCELTIKPKVLENGSHTYMMDPNYLHIWPRESYMMIALPNTDYTFTCTLFMPFDQFDRIENESDLIAFFEKSFPDSIPLIGRDNLTSEYFKNPKASLVSIKVNPTYYSNKVVLLGDAAHSIVPFYGQGMNAGFEDVFILFETLDNITDKTQSIVNNTKLESALKQFSETRYLDITAIGDLAMRNYIEMRSSVNSYNYLFKKRLYMALHYFFPNTFVPLYTMVSFTSIPYAQVVEKDSIQNKRLNYLITLFGIFATSGLLYSIRKPFLNYFNKY